MAKIVELKDYLPEPDIDAMDKAALTDYLRQLHQELEALDRKEPRNMNTEAYERWADEHEELEDLVDEVLDRLDEM